MLTRNRNVFLLFAVLLAFGCKSEADKQREAADQQHKIDEEADRRAKVIAEQTVQKYQADEDQKRKAEADAAAQEKKAEADAHRAAKQAAMQKLMRNPGPFFEASGLTLFNKGIINAYAHARAVTLVNKSQFPVTDIRATLDFRDKSGQPFATVPVQLSGAIAPGQSVTFSEQAGTLSDGTTQLQKAPTTTTFTVTSVRIASTGALAEQ